MPRFAEGVARFQKEAYPEKKSLFEKLSKGQSPEALFITCSDSRIDTAMITQSDPGDLFVCRNAGNIVPPHNAEQNGGMTASIEYAVSVLKVPHIVVCGHSGCGAMQGVMHPETLNELPHVKAWIANAKPAYDALGNEAGQSEEARLARLIEQNVIVQLENIKAHPAVAARLAEGGLTLHGWVYDIKTGEVLALNDSNNAFEPV